MPQFYFNGICRLTKTVSVLFSAAFLDSYTHRTNNIAYALCNELQRIAYMRSTAAEKRLSLILKFENKIIRTYLYFRELNVSARSRTRISDIPLSRFVLTYNQNIIRFSQN